MQISVLESTVKQLNALGESYLHKKRSCLAKPKNLVMAQQLSKLDSKIIQSTPLTDAHNSILRDRADHETLKLDLKFLDTLILITFDYRSGHDSSEKFLQQFFDIIKRPFPCFNLTSKNLDPDHVMLELYKYVTADPLQIDLRNKLGIV